MSVPPRHLCTSFWTVTKVAFVYALHAQVLCAMTVDPTKNTVLNAHVQIAAYVQLVPTCLPMKITVYSVLLVIRRNNYCIVDIVKRQVTGNHLKRCTLERVYTLTEQENVSSIRHFQYLFTQMEFSRTLFSK